MNFTRSINSRKHRASLALVWAIVFAAVGAVSFTNQVLAGTLEVRVKDHREAIGDFSKLEMVVESLRVSPKAGLKFWQMGWKEVKPALNKIDLTRYTGTRSAMIFKGEVNDGSFEGIHLKLKNVEGIAKKTNSPVSVRNLVGPIQLPFSVSTEYATLIILDLVVIDVSDHPPAGYELRLKGYELYTDGQPIGKAPPG